MTLRIIALGGLLTLLLPVVAVAEGKTIRAATDAELVKAITAAQPGDTIVIADGSYAETLAVKKSGTGPTQRLTIRAENSRKAVFSRKGMAARVEGSFLRLEGLVFDSQYGNSTCVRASGKDIQFVDCEIRRPGTVDEKPWGDGLQFYDSADCLVERCWIHHCLASQNGQREDSHGIRFTHSHDMTVRGCLIDLVSGDCVQVDPNRDEWDNILIEGCKLSGGKVAKDDPLAHPKFAAGSYTSENGIDTKTKGKGKSRITIRDCEAYGFRGPIGNAAAFNIKEPCEAVIDRCTISDSQIGLRLRGPARVKVTNCVLHNNDTHCRYEDRIPQLYFYHCTFGRFTDQGRGFFQEQKPSPDLKVINCLFLDKKPGQAGDASNQAVESKAFVDLAKGDYRLSASVPAGSKPAIASEAELKVDRAGSQRQADKVPDAGAYQYRPR
jgi:hypothetical protein